MLSVTSGRAEELRATFGVVEQLMRGQGQGHRAVVVLVGVVVHPEHARAHLAQTHIC